MITHKREAKHSKKTTLTVFDSVKGLAAEEWNKISKDSSFLSYTYLETFEKNSPGNIAFRYVLAQSAGHYCCVAYMQLIDIEGDSVTNFLQSASLNGTGKYVQKKLGQHSDCIKIRLLVCGNVFISGEHGFAYNKNTIGGIEAFDCLDKMVDMVVKREQKNDPVSMVLIKDFYEPSLVFSKYLKKEHYNNFRVDPNMILEIDAGWKNFESYLSSLSSKYRVRAKNIAKHGEKVMAKDFSVEDIKANEERIMLLYMDLQQRAKFRPAAYTIDTFTGFKESFNDRFVFTGYFVEEILVAFKTYFIVGPGNDVEAHFVGFESVSNKKYELYQNMLYHYINEAIALGSSKVFFGRTALEIKSNVGARPYELVCYIKHVNPVFNFMIKPFIKHLQPDGWVMRNPFKKVLGRLS